MWGESFFIYREEKELIALKRTLYCGQLREEHIGKQVVVNGWVQTKRDMGGVIFIDLYDREGTLQVVFDAADLTAEQFAVTESLKSQSVIGVKGTVRLRSKETVNPKIATGTVELMAEAIELISSAEALPFSLDDDTNVREDLRLKYRFLDIRRPKMLGNLRYRHRVQKAAEDFLDAEGFLQIETPILTKSTPEGARDYLVPSRVHAGTFYALPQSPQIFKQLLMVGGVDKYYQVARCFRDEDLRADRQPEFTQVDMEMSFVEQEDILVHLEKLFKHIFKEVKGIDFKEPFPRMTWHEAMDSYGSDKPDIRFGLPIVDITEISRQCSFTVFRKVAETGGVVRAINVKGCADFSRSTIEELTRKAMSYGAKGMAWIAIRPDGEIYSILKKHFAQSDLDAIIEAVKGEPGDFILFCADKLDVVRKTLGALRLDLGDLLGLRDKQDYKFLIVTDFPQFEWSEEEGRFVATHHPFTMPYPEDIQYLMTDPGKVRAQAYDFVLNGVELGSGSIRIHKQDVQRTMFEALGFSQEEIESRFGFMVNAYRYGTPPHGGFAFGLDRLVMLMVGADSLREVIAFPKLRDASCPMTNAPDVVDQSQLEVLNLGMGAAKAGVVSTASKLKRPSTEIDVDNVANLAMLNMTREEKDAMGKELAAIISFADQLSSLDTKDVPITAHVVPMQNVFREDKVVCAVDRDALLANAPTQQDGYICLPRIVE
ncbi:MAG: aspartate--tRNA ligase [Oscillospiraceae bacterium]|nr:aspartate--tRNA ligase [Oscillospiraceae bacterium]